MTKPITPATLPNINDQVQEMRKRFWQAMREQRKYEVRRFEEQVRQLEQNRLAILLLAGEGVEMTTGAYREPGEWVYVDLGDATKGKRARERVEAGKKAVARALSKHREEAGKEVANGRRGHVKITLKPAGYDRVVIEDIDRLPADGRCRIKKQTSRASRSTFYRAECSV